MEIEELKVRLECPPLKDREVAFVLKCHYEEPEPSDGETPPFPGGYRFDDIEAVEIGDRPPHRTERVTAEAWLTKKLEQLRPDAYTWLTQQ